MFLQLYKKTGKLTPFVITILFASIGISICDIVSVDLIIVHLYIVFAFIPEIYEIIEIKVKKFKKI